jgi:hypothetical protein
MEGKIKPTENSTPRQQEREEITVEREGRRLAEERSKLRSCGRGEARGREEGGVAGKGTCSLPSHHLAGLLLSPPHPLSSHSLLMFLLRGARKLCSCHC